MSGHSKNDEGEHSSNHAEFDSLYENTLKCLRYSNNRRRKIRYMVRLAEKARDLAALPQVQKWIVLLELAVSLELRGVKLITMTKLYNGLAVLRLQSGQYPQAADAFRTMYELAEKINHPQFIREAETGWLVADMYLNAQNYGEEETRNLLSYQRTQSISPDMLYRLKQALGFIQYYWHRFDGAINLLEEVALYWERRGNSIELGRTAYVLAVMYRGDLNFAEAARYLDKAEVALRNTEYIWQYASVANEYGTLAMFEHEYESAVHWHRTALAELNRMPALNNEQRLSIVHMCLGIALVYEGSNLQEAEMHFGEVYRIATKENQPYLYGKYQSYHGFAFAAFRGGNHNLARDYALKGREMTAEELPEEQPFRENMLKNYDDLINAIEEGCDPLDVLPYPNMPQRFGGSSR